MAKAQATISGVKGLRRDLKKIAKPSKGSSVNVGFINTANYPTETQHGRQPRKDPPPIAQVAFWNEFGTKGGGWGGPIPSRPFIRLTIEKLLDDPKIDYILKKMMDPTDPSLNQQLADTLGSIMVGVMRETIKDKSFKPNAPSTIEIKTKGRGGNTTPLIDEGYLRGAISHEVK